MPTRKPRRLLSAAILEQASTWFVEFSEGDVSETLRTDFFQWLCTSPEHIRAYLEIAGVYEDAQSLNKTRPQDIQQLLARARDETNIVTLSESPSRHPRESEDPVNPPHLDSPRSGSLPLVPASATDPQPLSSHTTVAFAGGTGRGLLGLAASVLIATAGISSWFFWQRDNYATQIGEQRLITLADGSTLELNARSRVRVHFSKHQRDVDLTEGQALFHVAKDPTRPFVVRSDTTQIRAVGTQFDVYRKTIGTIVTVVEGQVAVMSTDFASPPSDARPEQRSEGEGRAESAAPQSPRTHTAGEFLLTAGEQATVPTHDTTQHNATPKRVDVAATTAWTQRQLVFKSAPLSEVVEQYNRYNRRPLVLHDPQLADIRISGVFSAIDPEPLLAFLRAQPHITVVDHNGGSELEIVMN